MNLVFTDLSFRNKTGQGITTEVVIGEGVNLQGCFLEEKQPTSKGKSLKVFCLENYCLKKKSTRCGFLKTKCKEE